MTAKPMPPASDRPTTLAVSCPVPGHGQQAAPAATVRIVRRTSGDRVIDRVIDWTLTAPCPTPGCPVVLLYAGHAADATELSLQYLARLNAAGAALLTVTTGASTPAAAITDAADHAGVSDVTHFAFPDPGGAA